MPFFDDVFSLNIPRFRVSLRLSGDSLDPEFLTQQLGVMPTESGRKGEPRDDGIDGGRDTGTWCYGPSMPSDTELGEVLDLLLAALPDDATLWEELTSTFAVDLACAVYLEAERQGTTVDAAVLQRLARLGLALRFDFHGTGALEERER